MPNKTAAERIEDTALDAERYSRGILSAGTVRAYAHIGAECALHELSMLLIEQHGGQRTVSMRTVATLIGRVRASLDRAKEISSTVRCGVGEDGGRR